MADDNTNGQTEEGGSTFGEVTEREEVTDAEGNKPVLVADKVTAVEPETKVEGETEGEVTPEGAAKTETKTEEVAEEGKKPELTEKGTKLDPNPQSAVHQELANERKVRSNYEKVLADPKLLAQFAKQQYNLDIPVAGEKTGAEVAVEAIKEFKAEDFESLEDVANVVNGLQKSFLDKTKSYEEEIKTLKGNVSGLLQGGKQQQIADNIKGDIVTLQKLPELTPGNPDYIEGLEQAIVGEYDRLDFDKEVNIDGQPVRVYKGQHSMAEIAERKVKEAKTFIQAGSQKAQTIVKDKTTGKVKTSPTTEEETDTSTLTPGDSIALGISKMFK